MVIVTSLLIDANDNFSWRILLWYPVLLDTSSALYFNINNYLDPNYIHELGSYEKKNPTTIEVNYNLNNQFDGAH